VIVNSVFRENRLGIGPNSGSYEGCYPERETTIVGNHVYDNGNPGTDAIDAALVGNGNGILVGGGIGNVIERNLVEDHPVAGIAVVPLPEDDPIAGIPDEADRPVDCVEDAVAAPDDVIATLDNPLLWPSIDNRIVDNVVSGSGEWDLVLLTLDGEGQGNCFAGNQLPAGAVTAPPAIEEVLPCDGAQQSYQPEIARFLELVEADQPPPVDYREVELPDPGELEGMPDPENASVEPARGPREVDLATITVPDGS
jgi:hypothetical protein